MKSIVLRLYLCLAVAILATANAATARAESCRFLKVRANSANVSKDPRADSVFIDLLDKNDVVCVTRTQKVGDVDLVYIPYKLPQPGQRVSVEGWVDRAVLKPMTPEEVAAATGESAPAPAATPSTAVAEPPRAAETPRPAAVAGSTAAKKPAAPAASAPAKSQGEALQYSKPIESGPYPVAGSSIEQLANGAPMFPPFEGLDESLWKKPCASCHKWDRNTLCVQGGRYVKDPQLVMRHPHPYGGAFKATLMDWARAGCH